MEFDNRSPVKSKKPKSFKFLHKKEKEKDEKDKEEKKEEKKRGKEGKREEKKKEREKEKEEKLRAKEEKKRNKQEKKKHVEAYTEDSACVVFGVPLSVAVERSPTHDGVKLPVLVRQCIDYIQQHGLECEGIYRLSGVKSKVQQLRRCYNSAAHVCLEGQDPHVVASLLKQFLRELPEPVLTADMTTHFEDASQIPGWRDRADAIRQLLHRLPTPNTLLVNYILAHMGHIIDREIDTKMNYQNVCIVLSPTMRISHRVLNVFFQNHSFLFGDIVIKRYVAPVCSSGEVENVWGQYNLQQEVGKQEAVLAHLHKLLAASPHNTVVQERLWEAQRILTLLKRKVKLNRREECELMRAIADEQSSEDSQRESISDTTNNSNSINTTLSDSVAAPAETTTASQQQPTNNSSNRQTQQIIAVPDTEDINRQQQQLKVSAKRSASQEIPKLPAPVSSGRGERSKLAHNKSTDLVLSTGQANDAAEVPRTDSTTDRINTNANNNSNNSHAQHVTVINVTSTCNVNIPSTSTASHTTTASVAACDVASTAAAHETAATTCNTIPAAVVNSDADSVNAMAETTAAPLAAAAAAAAAAADDDDDDDDAHYETICVDAELVSLVREEAQQLAQQAELLAMSHDLSRKLRAESNEITRLKDEIQELQTLYGYRMHCYDSSESGGSDSAGAAADSDTEEEELLLQLQQHNTLLQHNNSDLVQRIQEEREAVVLLKARLRQTQASSYQQLPPPPLPPSRSLAMAH